MYDSKTTPKIQKIASDAIDSAQAKIDQLNEMGATTRTKVTEELFGWQSWLGNIAFALSAILGAILIEVDSINSYYILSFVLFLATGLWITLFHKHLFERGVIIGSSSVDEYRILYDDKKKAAFELFMDPSSVEKHIEFLEQELAISKKSLEDEKSLLNKVSNDKTSYINDIWLTMLLSAIYFMVQPVLKIAYERLGFSAVSYEALYWLIWVALVSVIWKYEAFSTKDSIEESKQKKIEKINSQIKHSTAYVKRVKNETDYLRKRFDDFIKSQE